jgi:hypothetical protein
VHHGGGSMVRLGLSFTLAPTCLAWAEALSSVLSVLLRSVKPACLQPGAGEAQEAPCKSPRHSPPTRVLGSGSDSNLAPVTLQPQDAWTVAGPDWDVL